jgi:hypothetical protein
VTSSRPPTCRPCAAPTFRPREFILNQGWQIFTGKTYQNGENYANHHNIGIPNDHKIYQTATEYTK